MAANSKLDILVWGANGFTGQLVVKYLSSTRTAPNVSWGVAGRSKAKLEAALKEAGAPASIPVFVADAADEASLVDLVKKTRVVISLVGPYLLYGAPLVKACAENGVSYLDLTAETPFITDCIKLYAKAAVSTRAIIIHAAGFDSIPSDLCAYLAVQQLKKVGGERVDVGRVTSSVATVGKPSGGTVATMWSIFAYDSEQRKVTGNPYALSPIQGKHQPTSVFVTSFTYQGRRTWGGLWVMAPFNGQLVRRSWGILEGADPSSKVLSYGPNFSYVEFLEAKSFFAAFLTSTFFYVALACIAFLPPVRWFLQKYWLQPGDGPTPEEQKQGWFRLTTTAKSVDEKTEVQVVMRGKGDPGYSGTAAMICEAALAIAMDYDRLPPLAKTGGPLTPATALGNVLVERLEASGIFSFAVEDGKSK